MNNLAAAAFAGELGFGSGRRDWMEVKMAPTVYADDHIFWRMSKHRLPSAYTAKIREKQIIEGQ